MKRLLVIPLCFAWSFGFACIIYPPLDALSMVGTIVGFMFLYAYFVGERWTR